MPTHKSAIKRHRQSLKRRDHNRTLKAALHTAITKVRAAVTAGDSASAKELLKAAEKSLQRAGSRHTVHPRNAARKISRMTKLIGRSSKK